ncbi:MAG: DnaJ domain-containing protein [Alphaproteobacteria bacterium]|nr:DnaJ domain-containing protein [Alphaproteobacteria bacterium]
MRGRYKLHPFFEESETVGRTHCMQEGCALEGLYPAPKSPERLQDRYWFCLEHVRLYNASWNYYAHMKEDEIEASRREDVTWQRPSWPFSQGKFSYYIPSFDDVESLLGKTFRGGQGILDSQETQALAVLDLTYPLTQEVLKTRYKMLAKRFHPDLNQGCRQAEEHLKNVNQAYSVLQKLLRRLTPVPHESSQPPL